MDINDNHPPCFRRRHSLVAPPVTGAKIRLATVDDWPSIVMLRRAYFHRIGRVFTERTLEDGEWRVAEYPPGEIAAASMTRDFETIRYVFDFVRQERYRTMLPAIELIRSVQARARADGMTLLGNVDKKNQAFEVLLLATGEWEAIGTLYRLKATITLKGGEA